MNPLLDAVLVDIGGTLVEEAPPGTPTDELTVELRPHVLRDLTKIARRVQLGAVTNTAVMTETDVRSLLAPSGLNDLLEVVVTSTDVGRAKPHPAPLHEAMRRLGLDDPTRVLYVGDAPSDAAAADAAGMYYVDVATSFDGRLAGAVDRWIEHQAGERIEKARAAVVAAEPGAGVEAGRLHDTLTKPRGSLGRLESLGVQLAAIAGTCPPPLAEPPAVVVFAADHGAVASGISAWPQEVTAQMVANVADGGAAINVLARQLRATVSVVDVGVAMPLPADADIHRRAVQRGTNDLTNGPAMSRADALLALDVGVEFADRCVAGGARCLVTGDMGIGNTTSSAAIIAAATGRPPAEVTGRGAGADPATIARKVEVISIALERLSGSNGANGPLAMLQALGGFEIAALAGFIVGGAAHRVPIVIDGVIACAALLIACGLAPEARGYTIAGHRSVEPGAAAALEFVGLEPLLDLDLRLGEGTGAVLAVPLVQCAARLLNEMATFDGAGVTDKR